MNRYTFLFVGALGCSGYPVIGTTSSNGGNDAIDASGGSGAVDMNTNAGGVHASGGSSSGTTAGNDFCSGSVATPITHEAGAAIVSDLAVQLYRTCALVQGELECWGFNGAGQLGNGTTTNSCLPVRVQGLTSVTTVALGNSSCAVDSDSAYCWGDAGYGHTGVGVPSNSLVPLQYQGLTSGVSSVAVGIDYACAIINGGVQCWGHLGWDDQYGNGVTQTMWTLVPTPVPSLTSSVTALAASWSHTCAIIDGGIQCWGANNDGQLGNGLYRACEPKVICQPSCTTYPPDHCHDVDAQGRSIGPDGHANTGPVQVVGLTGVSAVTAGEAHTCAIVAGAAFCWGYNGSGQLGDGTTEKRSIPTQVQGLTSGVTAISASDLNTCAIVNEAALCWGSNIFGQVGDGTTTMRLVPTKVPSLTSGVTAIAAGTHACAIVDGVVKCWGDNRYGQLGNGNTADSSIPVDVIGL